MKTHIFLVMLFFLCKWHLASSGSARSVKRVEEREDTSFNTWDNIFFFVVLQQLNKIEKTNTKAGLYVPVISEGADSVRTTFCYWEAVLVVVVSCFGALQKRQC